MGMILTATLAPLFGVRRESGDVPIYSTILEAFQAERKILA